MTSKAARRARARALLRRPIVGEDGAEEFGRFEVGAPVHAVAASLGLQPWIERFRKQAARRLQVFGDGPRPH